MKNGIAGWSMLLLVLAMGASALTAHATPNLTPYQPAGWSDKIVVARSTGTTTDSTGLSSADTLYINWAVINNGSTTANGTFYTYLYVDGVFNTSWSTVSLPAGSYTYVNNFYLGSLSAGTHTIEIFTDATSVIAESNESDNTYTKTITIGNPPLPNLTPYQPSGWSDKIVVARSTGTTTDSTGLTSADTLYINWAVINNGNAAVTSTFYTYLYVDGVYQYFWTTTSLPAGSYTYINNYSLGSLSAGTHTIEIFTDATGVVAESNESDNTYTKTITIGNPPLPNLIPYQPSGWSDKIVVARNTGTTTDAVNLTTADTLYVNWAVVNNGSADVMSTFETYLYVDGKYQDFWTTASLDVGSYTYVNGYSISSLSAGTHTIEIYTDATGAIPESNENDNSYTKTITIALPNLPAPALNNPVYGSTTQSTTPTFGWSSVTGASSYRVIVATNPADLPSNPTADTGGPSVVINTTTPSTTFSPASPLNAATTYYWEVHARSPSQYGAWSATDMFSTVNGLTILPIFDSSITSDPQAAAIEATINSAIAGYHAHFSNPITVSIEFKEMDSGLGQSVTYLASVSYAAYRTALAANAATADDATALTYLPATANNPVNGSQYITLKDPLARALGFAGNPPAGDQDGIIGLNTSILNLSSAQNNPNLYSLSTTVSHEIDEVLGLGSALNNLNNGDPAPTYGVYPEDLFRYDQNGARSFTTDLNASAYFSINGVTQLAQFNQYMGGDFGDWYSYSGDNVPQVQDAFGTPGSSPVLGVELQVLDVIGYTRISLPLAITSSAGAGGSINPAGGFNKSPGDSQGFVASPAYNYTVNQWLVDGNVMQSGGLNYTLSNIQSPHNVQVTFTYVPGESAQTISFGPLANRALGEAPFLVTATASSGLPVSLSILSGPATISNGTVNLTGTGSVVVDAAQPGNASYNAAPNVNQQFTVYAPPKINLVASNNSLIFTWLSPSGSKPAKGERFKTSHPEVSNSYHFCWFKQGVSIAS